jgi:hypothetical protein
MSPTPQAPFTMLSTISDDATDDSPEGGLVRPMRPGEATIVATVLRSLSPAGSPEDFAALRVLVWERARQGVGGFVAFAAQPSGDGSQCIRRVWVASYLRTSGVERALLHAASASSSAVCSDLCVACAAL